MVVFFIIYPRRWAPTGGTQNVTFHSLGTTYLFSSRVLTTLNASEHIKISSKEMASNQTSQWNKNMPSGFQRFETVIPPKTMSLEYEYQSFEDNAEWGGTQSGLLREMRGGRREQREDRPYYAIDEKASGHCESGSSMQVRVTGGMSSGETRGYSLVQKWGALLSNWLDRYGCGHVSSTGDNDLAPDVGYVPMH